MAWSFESLDAVEAAPMTQPDSTPEFLDPLLTANLAALEHTAAQLTASAVALHHKLAVYVARTRNPRPRRQRDGSADRSAGRSAALL